MEKKTRKPHTSLIRQMNIYPTDRLNNSRFARCGDKNSFSLLPSSMQMRFTREREIVRERERHIKILDTSSENRKVFRETFVLLRGSAALSIFRRVFRARAAGIAKVQSALRWKLGYIQRWQISLAIWLPRVRVTASKFVILGWGGRKILWSRD